jgi:hypothetical protein
MNVSLEYNKYVENLNRQIRVWIKSNSLSSRIQIGCHNGTLSEINLDTSKHHPVIVELDDQSENTLEVSVMSGEIEVGNIEINYSVRLNQYFKRKYPMEIEILQENNFDISKISKEFFQDLQQQDLLESTGADDFSAMEDLRQLIKINGHSIEGKKSEWIKLCTEELMLVKIYATTPVLSSKDKKNWRYKIDKELFNLDFKLDKNYDQSFINGIDTKFYEYVNTKLANKHTNWDDNFTKYTLPYSNKIRIQTQLLDNQELIKNRHVLDLGSDRGQFLYPCLLMNCKSITGVQPLKDYNQTINEALDYLHLSDRAQAVNGNVYDLVNLKMLLQNKNTVLMLGLIYHINNHYELLKTISESDIDAIVIDVAIKPYINHYEHYRSNQPSILYLHEKTGVDTHGIEITNYPNTTTFVGTPNAKWLIMTLEHMGWTIKSNKMITYLRHTHGNLCYRGIITAIRQKN